MILVAHKGESFLLFSTARGSECGSEWRKHQQDCVRSVMKCSENSSLSLFLVYGFSFEANRNESRTHRRFTYPPHLPFDWIMHEWEKCWEKNSSNALSRRRGMEAALKAALMPFPRRSPSDRISSHQIRISTKKPSLHRVIDRIRADSLSMINWTWTNLLKAWTLARLGAVGLFEYGCRAEEGSHVNKRCSELNIIKLCENSECSWDSNGKPAALNSWRHFIDSGSMKCHEFSKYLSDSSSMPIIHATTSVFPFHSLNPDPISSARSTLLKAS